MATTVSSISPDNPSDAIKTILAAIVEHAGGDFVGLQEPMPEQNLPAYVLFNHRGTGRPWLSGSMRASARMQFSAGLPSAMRSTRTADDCHEEKIRTNGSVGHLQVSKSTGPLEL